MCNMTMEKLCAEIKLPLQYVEEGKVSEQKETILKELFERDEDRFYEVLEQEEKPYQTALYLYTKWGAQVYPDYVNAGISDRVYYDTFKDLTIWCTHCINETGMPGMKQYRWTSLPIKMKIFRLGRLQFEPSFLRNDIIYKGELYKKNSKILEVHIPEGDLFSQDIVKKSFRHAETFFKDTYPYYACGFHCESWLLSPKLKGILTDTSNIIQFQNQFYVYNEISARQAEERVFGELLDKPEEYPENTSLQKKLKEYLQQEKKIGMGCGFIPIKD